jgi:hypothetical protein
MPLPARAVADQTQPSWRPAPRRPSPRDRLSTALFTGLNIAVFLALLSCVVVAAVLFGQGY